MFIVNSRFGKDKGIGKCTSRDISLIDYVVSSTASLKTIKDFEVLDFDPLFSDIHCPLHFKIEFETKHQTENRQQFQQYQRNTPMKWNQNSKQTFIDNIDRETVESIHRLFAENDTNNVGGKTFVNDVCRKISDLFYKSANVSFGDNHPIWISKKNDQKPWFGRECRQARSKYHLARRKFKNRRNDNNKGKMVSASKSYKKVMNKHINKYKKQFQKRLRNMSSTQPKKYWNLLNKVKAISATGIQLEVLHDFFKILNETDNDTDSDTDFVVPDEANTILDEIITLEEIHEAVQELKNNKAAGPDGILNEYIKSTVDIMIPVYLSLFNYVLDRGIFPDSWLNGVILPIYKGKGIESDPNNYRPITLLSCLGKLFTSILNKRVYCFLEAFELLNENQSGFRKGYSTTDSIFTLYSLIELLKARKKKLFCAFIDFSKAFDTVWRSGLWTKLLNIGIKGKVFNVIRSMYSEIKLCIKFNGAVSQYFCCKNGVRQGENLSPVLFAIFMNDLESFLLENGGNSIDFGINEDVLVYVKLIVLLYADDTIVFADNEHDLQRNLNIFQEYCDIWKLNINVAKTKKMLFLEVGT